MNNLNDVVIIFGYNNTRIYDIERLKQLCKQRFGADIVLCKDEISEQDEGLTKYAFAIPLAIGSIESVTASIKQLDDYIQEKQLNPIACLPFSDKGVPLGSYYAKHKSLNCDALDTAFACVDKYRFRTLEKQADTPDWYQKPIFKKLNNYQAAESVMKDAERPLFFKPTSEGNSRGCVKIESLSALEKNKALLAPYFVQGVIAEENISDCDEYSFDGIGGNYIIAEKKTSTSEYCVETQHIVPAPLADDDYARLIEAGKLVNNIVGSNNGAVHNELFFNKNNKTVYCVEPNRRPAGLKMWDWIKHAFNIDNWQNWLSWATGETVEVVSLKREYYVGCRMLQSAIDGKIKSINTAIIDELRENDNIIEIKIDKKVGDTVTKILKQNGDFLGYVVCKHKTIDGLRTLLEPMEKTLQRTFTIN